MGKGQSKLKPQQLDELLNCTYCMSLACPANAVPIQRCRTLLLLALFVNGCCVLLPISFQFPRLCSVHSVLRMLQPWHRRLSSSYAPPGSVCEWSLRSAAVSHRISLFCYLHSALCITSSRPQRAADVVQGILERLPVRPAGQGGLSQDLQAGVRRSRHADFACGALHWARWLRWAVGVLLVGLCGGVAVYELLFLSAQRCVCRTHGWAAGMGQ